LACCIARSWRALSTAACKSSVSSCTSAPPASTLSPCCTSTLSTRPGVSTPSAAERCGSTLPLALALASRSPTNAVTMRSPLSAAGADSPAHEASSKAKAASSATPKNHRRINRSPLRKARLEPSIVTFAKKRQQHHWR
jgi:hypothetical protein